MADKHWIKQTRERAAIMNEAADRAEAGEEPGEFVLFDGKPVGLHPCWWAAHIGTGNRYSLKPKRTLRAWTAEELTARIGMKLKSKSSVGRENELDYRLAAVITTTELAPYNSWSRCTRICVASACSSTSVSGIGAECLLRNYTQLDGSPCGVFEEVKG